MHRTKFHYETAQVTELDYSYLQIVFFTVGFNPREQIAPTKVKLEEFLYHVKP